MEREQQLAFRETPCFYVRESRGIVTLPGLINRVLVALITALTRSKSQCVCVCLCVGGGGGTHSGVLPEASQISSVIIPVIHQTPQVHVSTAALSLPAPLMSTDFFLPLFHSFLLLGLFKRRSHEGQRRCKFVHPGGAC